MKFTKKLKTSSKLFKLSKKKLKKKTKRIMKMKGGTVNEYVVECMPANNIKGHKCLVNKNTTLSKADQIAAHNTLALNIFINEELPSIETEIDINISSILTIEEEMKKLIGTLEIQQQIKKMKSIYENLEFLYHYIFSITSISETLPQMINLRDKKELIQEIKKNLLDLEEKNKIEKPPPVITTPTLITLDDSEILNQLRTNVELNKIQVGLMPHCGITNLGVTCYLNSVIQLLYSIPQVKYLFTNISQEKINQLTINSKENYETDQKNKKVLEGLKEIFLLMNGVIKNKKKKY